MKDRLADADLVFADPDNGLEPSGFSYGSSMVGKSVLFSELRELVEPGRCLIVYHLIRAGKAGTMLKWHTGPTAYVQTVTPPSMYYEPDRTRLACTFCWMHLLMFGIAPSKLRFSGMG